MKSFKFEVTMKVADLWIEDGFGAHSKKDEKRFAEQIQAALEHSILTWANLTTELNVSVKVTQHPDHAVIAKLQGYKSRNKKVKI
jgi:hypothetical protein